MTKRSASHEKDELRNRLYSIFDSETFPQQRLSVLLRELLKEFPGSMIASTIVQSVLISYGQLRSDPENTTMERLSQQVSFRLQSLSILGDTFVQNYRKVLSKTKSRGVHNRELNKELVWNDILSIVSLIALRLTANQSLTDALMQHVITPEISPETVHSLFDALELPNPWQPNEPSQATTALSPLRKVRTRNINDTITKSKNTGATSSNESVSSSSTTQTLTTTSSSSQPIHDSLWSTRPFSLTAPMRQKGSSLTQRARFVGSHFNSSHSNVSNLFRHVPLRSSTTIATTTSTTSTRSGPSTTLPSCRPTVVIPATPSVQPRQSMVVVSETPSVPYRNIRSSRHWESHPKLYI